MPNYGWREQSKCILIQIDVSSFAEFEISELEISRVNCMYIPVPIGLCPVLGLPELLGGLFLKNNYKTGFAFVMKSMKFSYYSDEHLPSIILAEF